MKRKEILRLVWINLIQNKFKVLLTSVGIIIGAATIVMVIAIGRGGQMDVAEQFKNLNAGAIDISYEMAKEELSGKSGVKESGKSFGGLPENLPSGERMPFNGDSQNMPSQKGENFSNNQGKTGNFGGFVRGGDSSDFSDRMNQEKITLTEEDVDELEVFVPDISSVSISYTTRSNVDGGNLEEETSYTIAGVKSIYAEISNLSFQVGEFIIDSNEENKDKVCILGASVAKEIFGSAIDAYDNTIYIDNRPYVINGVLEEVGTVSSGISMDDAVFIPYSTGVKYIAGDEVNPTITVIASDLNNIDGVMKDIETVLAESYPNAEFTMTDAGSKMEAASESNRTLTMLLFTMAFIVFIVGGIGIMNVLFVSVKERTKEIGILKAIGCSRKDILVEFLLEACFISIFGGMVGVAASFGVTPIVELINIRVELSAMGIGLALVFAIITGTIFGIYPAWKASNLVPVEALSEE
ncbi:MAG: FtsX-like permease family protein [Lachnospiraceae bacterium]|nr:FtsX-like permease family protein [Lachnospiraceae bacterium]